MEKKTSFIREVPGLRYIIRVELCGYVRPVMLCVRYMGGVFVSTTAGWGISEIVFVLQCICGELLEVLILLSLEVYGPEEFKCSLSLMLPRLE